MPPALMPVKTERASEPARVVEKAKLWATCKTTKEGKELCKAYNDQRTCSSPCRFGKVHVCDVKLLKTGALCGKSHPRSKHNESSDGKAAPRE